MHNERLPAQVRHTNGPNRLKDHTCISQRVQQLPLSALCGSSLNVPISGCASLLTVLRHTKNSGTEGPTHKQVRSRTSSKCRHRCSVTCPRPRREASSLYLAALQSLPLCILRRRYASSRPGATVSVTAAAAATHATLRAHSCHLRNHPKHEQPTRSRRETEKGSK